MTKGPSTGEKRPKSKSSTRDQPFKGMSFLNSEEDFYPELLYSKRGASLPPCTVHPWNTRMSILKNCDYIENWQVSALPIPNRTELVFGHKVDYLRRQAKYYEAMVASWHYQCF